MSNEIEHGQKRKDLKGAADTIANHYEAAEELLLSDVINLKKAVDSYLEFQQEMLNDVSNPAIAATKP